MAKIGVLLVLAFVVASVAAQGNVAQNVSNVLFPENYESQSDAQHFKMLENGRQVQLVLDEYAGDFLSCERFLLLEG